jgi:hypothetical protein
MSMEVSTRFIEGLKEYNLSLKEIQNGDWSYAGGNFDSHIKKFKLIFGDIKFPDVEKYCVCGHEIIHNCYIMNKKKEILVIGSCCIKKFMPNKFKIQCEICNKPHLNRKDNKCNDCRKHKYINKCIDCNKGKCSLFKKCNDCSIGKCLLCNKKIDEKYKLCFTCNKNIHTI